jgi:hypothetical protein
MAIFRFFGADSCQSLDNIFYNIRFKRLFNELSKNILHVYFRLSLHYYQKKKEFLHI